MPEAARPTDMTQHGPPLTGGPASPDVMIGMLPAWRALPGGMGAGIEDASKTMKDLMGAAKLDVGSTPAKLAKVFSSLMQDAGKAAGEVARPLRRPSAAGLAR